MTKAELAAKPAKDLEITQKKASEAMDAALTSIEEIALSGGKRFGSPVMA